MKRLNLIAGMLACLGFCGVASAVPITAYRLVDLGVLPGDSTSSSAGINNRGEVVGSSDSRAFLYSSGGMIDLGSLDGGGYHSSANAINDRGEITGFSYHSGNSHQQAILYSGGSMTGLGTLPGSNADRGFSIGRGINNSGQVAGQNYDGSKYGAFLYSSNGMEDLGTLSGFPASYAVAINNNGNIVGNLLRSTGSHAFLYSNGVMSDLGALPGDTEIVASDINDNDIVVGVSRSQSHDYWSFIYDGEMKELGTLPNAKQILAAAINNKNEVVGSATFDSSDARAFLYRDGSMFDLTSLLDALVDEWLVTAATGINDLGQIAAIGDGLNGIKRALRLDPISVPESIPEPTVFSLMTLGLFSLGYSHRRRLLPRTIKSESPRKNGAFP